MSQSNEAEIPNPALEPFSFLIGAWQTIGTHPYVPNSTFHGKTTFEYIQGGAFILMRSEINEEGIPSGISILGSDDVAKTFYTLYFDERKISRKYDVTIEGSTLTWSRTTPEFSQRMRLEVSEDKNTIVSKGEMQKEGGAWEPDLELTYLRTHK